MNWIKTLFLQGILSSKKFWYMVIGMLTTVFSEKLNLNPDEVQNILISIGALILGQGFADFGKEAKKDK